MYIHAGEIDDLADEQVADAERSRLGRGVVRVAYGLFYLAVAALTVGAPAGLVLLLARALDV